MIVFTNRNLSLLLFIALILLFMDSSVAFRFSTGTKSEPSQAIFSPGDVSKGETSMNSHETSLVDTDLIALMRPLPADQSGVFSNALNLLKSMRASPSCNWPATQILVKSCQAIEGSAHDHEESLDDIKSIYAAQLAMCEISSAGPNVPECKYLKLTNDHSTEGKVSPRGLNKSEKHQLSQCLKSLESRPQWWTSYSNNKQSAVVMCHAARVDTEKDDMIKHQMSLAQISKDVAAALSKVIEIAADNLSDQRDFAVAINTLQKRLLQDLESFNSKIQTFFEQVVNSISAAIQGANQMLFKTKEAESSADKLHNDLRASNAEVVRLEKTLGGVFDGLKHMASDLAAKQAGDWEISHNLATGLQGSLQAMRNNEVPELRSTLGEIQNSLYTSNELSSSIFYKQSKIEERLANLDQSIANLESKAESIHGTQAAQIDAQARISDNIDQIQTELFVTQGILTDITAKASGVLSIIEESSIKVTHLAALNRIASSAIRWGWLILIIYQCSPWHARTLGIALSLFTLVSISGILTNPLSQFFGTIPADTSLIHYASGYQIPHPRLLTIVAFCGFISAIAILCRLYYRPSTTADPTTKSDLKSPFLEKLRLRRVRLPWQV